MKQVCRVLALVFLVEMISTPCRAAEYVLAGWNDLGMHCLDPDYSIFSLLPPHNTNQPQSMDCNAAQFYRLRKTSP